jgi:catalase
MWINAAGEEFWVKYHFKTDQGIECFTQDEADQMAAVDTDYHTRDLFEHIRDGDHPSWTLFVQIMPYEDAKTYRFNPFDLTKVWPHGDYPLTEVGRMTLDRNLVPGIGPSPDRMLLARLFSYADAHRHRLGGNYQQIPVNSPVVETHSYSKDGAMRVKKVSDPVYAPNSYGGPAADATQHVPTWQADGDIMRTAYVDHAEDDDWGQPGTLVREVMDDAARARLVDNVVGHLLNGVSEPVLERAFEYWHNIDKEIGDRIEAGVREKAAEKDPKAADQGNPARETMQAKA